MTLHPLTKKLLSGGLLHTHQPEAAINRIVLTWVTERAEWLKLTVDYGANFIDDAFQFVPETLEEKFDAIRRKYDHKYPSPKDFWDAMCKEFAEVATEHFANQFSGKTVNYSREEDSTPTR